ncbi:hypothetical protein Q8W71_18135 [Methylobacterium sp. NEAU 140]|uniref:hypothetical protein n=1 Tax=Methylobacterium sp. NEAU 140 TaxID=3064945 RepID=UPI00273510A8|nr:hypothetical protein [Methylobacterium sp. NEAU 140]MDP4024547.1 hypothetical protein [Methylobacterium sp. NEAU 140]
MPDDFPRDDGDRRRAASTLARIAEVLSQPRHAFLDADAPADLAGATELLRHWSGLAEAERREVLAFVRAVAAAKSVQDGARE